MVAVVTPGITPGMWLPAAHFAAHSKHPRRSAQPTFQTTSLAVPEWCAAHGRLARRSLVTGTARVEI